MIWIPCCCFCELLSPLRLGCSSQKVVFSAPPPIRRFSLYAPRHHFAVYPSAAPEGACECPLAAGGRAVASEGAACALHPFLAAGTHHLLAWPRWVRCVAPRFGVCAFHHPHVASGAASALRPPHGCRCSLGGEQSAGFGVHRPASPWSGSQPSRGLCSLARPVWLCRCAARRSPRLHMRFAGSCWGLERHVAPI